MILYSRVINLSCTSVLTLENVILQQQIFAKHPTYLEFDCIKAQDIPLLRARSDYVYLCGRSFVFTNCMHNMLTRIQEIIASSSPLRQCFGVPHALASDANIPWRTDDLLSAESACARTSRRFMIDGCTVSSLRIRHASVRTTGNGTRDERYFGRIRARQSHWTITKQNARVYALPRFPGNRLSQFSIGEFRSRSLHHCWWFTNAELIKSFATRTCISYSVREKICFSFFREKNPVALNYKQRKQREHLSLARLAGSIYIF